MLVSEDLFGKVSAAAMSFSYSDEIEEDFRESPNEDDFEKVDDKALDDFDDDIYGDELDADDEQVAVDASKDVEFGDDFLEDTAEADD